MKWKDKLIRRIEDEIDNALSTIKTKNFNRSSIKYHLGIFNEPFLALIYKGEKKIESRFSMNKVSPFQKVAENDIVILKSSGGPVTGFFIAGKIHYYSFLNNEKLAEIQKRFGKDICSAYDPNFWQNRVKANYATLIEVKNVFPVNPFKIEKKDRLAWSIVREHREVEFTLYEEEIVQ